MIRRLDTEANGKSEMACCDSLVHMFSILSSCICFEFWLVHLIVYVFCDCSPWLPRFSRKEHFIPTKCKVFHHWRANICYRRMMRIWRICAKTEGRVFMYCSKTARGPSPQKRNEPRGCIAWSSCRSCTYAKLWAANSLESSPPFESKSLVSLVNLPQIKKKPDWKVNRGTEVGKGVWDSK